MGKGVRFSWARGWWKTGENVSLFCNCKCVCKERRERGRELEHLSKKWGSRWWGEHSVRAAWKAETARSESSPHHFGGQNNGCSFGLSGKLVDGDDGGEIGGGKCSPPSERGGRGHERDVQVARQTSDKGRDGGSTAECRCNKPETCQKQAGKVFCGRAMRKVGVTASRSTPPDALPIRSEYSFLGHSVRRAPPPLGGGENARAHSVRPTGAGNSFRFPFHKNTEDFTAPKERPGSGRLPGRGEGRD